MTAIRVDTDTNTVTITDDYGGVLTAHRGTFLSSNFFAKKLNEKRLDVSVTAAFYELEYTVYITNRDEVYYLSLEHQGQMVKDISLEQWNSFADAVYKSYQPWTASLVEAGVITEEEAKPVFLVTKDKGELDETTKTNLLVQAELIASSLNKVVIDRNEENANA